MTTSLADFIAIVTNISLFQGAQAHVIVMEETAFPRNVLVPLAGNDCRGLTTLSVGDMVQFHILQLVSSSTRDLDVRYNFKRAATCESNQHT